MLLEALLPLLPLLPLLAATLVAIGIAYGLAALIVSRIAPAGTPVPVPGPAYYLTMAAGVAGSLLVILAAAAAAGARHASGEGAVRVSSPGSGRVPAPRRALIRGRTSGHGYGRRGW